MAKLSYAPLCGSLLVLLLLLSAAVTSEALRELRGMQKQDAMKKALGCKLEHAVM